MTALMLVDVDSTLYDAEELFQKIAAEESFNWVPNSTYWARPEALGYQRVDLDRLFRKAHSREEVMNTTPYPGAVSVLNSIADNYDVEMWYVSHRNAQAEGVLKDWISREDFPFPENVRASRVDKRLWIKDNLPDIVIDDRVQTILCARYEIGATVFAIEQPHNINLTGEDEGIHICKSWFDIEQILQEVLNGRVKTTV